MQAAFVLQQAHSDTSHLRAHLHIAGSMLVASHASVMLLSTIAWSDGLRVERQRDAWMLRQFHGGLCKIAIRSIWVGKHALGNKSRIHRTHDMCIQFNISSPTTREKSHKMSLLRGGSCHGSCVYSELTCLVPRRTLNTTRMITDKLRAITESCKTHWTWPVLIDYC